MSAHESKPEWFQLADEDWAASPQAVDAKSVRARRKNPIRLMAISTPLLVLGAGLFIAQSQDAPQAFASAATTNVATTNVASTPIAPASSNPVASAQSSAVVESAPAPSNMAPITTTPKISSPSSSSALSTLNSGLVLPAKGSVQSGDDGDDEGQENGQDEGQDD